MVLKLITLRSISPEYLFTQYRSGSFLLSVNKYQVPIINKYAAVGIMWYLYIRD